MTNPIIMHVNFGERAYDSYGKRTVDGVCKMAAELGFDGVEFRGTPPIEYREAGISFTDYVKEVAAGKKEYGLKEIIFAIGDRDCANPDKDVRAKSIENIIERARIVNGLCGTTICNTFGNMIRSKISTVPPNANEFHGSAAATPEDWELTADTYHRVGEAIQPLGMRFGFETHMKYIHDMPHSTKKLLDMINSPVIGVNMDFGNTVYFPEHPSVTEAIDLYGDKLFYTHLKNSVAISTGGRMGTYLSDGQINHREYLGKLKEVGYTGPIGIESPRGGDRYWYAKTDIAYAKSVMESL